MRLSTQQPISVEAYIQNNYEKASLASLSESEIISVDFLAIPWLSWLQTWLTYLTNELPQASSYELSLQLVNDEQMQQINHQYRQQNKPTDVLAFAALETDMPKPADANYLEEPLYLGDLIISLDTAAKQAQQQKHSLTIELAWLSSHGLLHLLGWDHVDEPSLEEMLNLQAKLLKTVNII